MADLCVYLANKGHETQVICYHPLTTQVRASDSETWRGARIRRIRWFSHDLFHKLEPFPLVELIYLAPMLFWFTLLFIARPSRRPDVIHSHGLAATSVAVAIGKLLGIRRVASLHTIYRLKERKRLFSRLVALLLSGADKILVPSVRARDELVSVGVSPRRVDTYTYWVDQSLFRPIDKEACRRLISLRSSGLVVLFVGRLIESKLVRPLLHAAEKLPEHTFLFVGDGPLRRAVEESAVKASNIVFLGRRDSAQLPVTYNCADLLWGAADIDYVGRAVIEALSCGIQVMLSNRTTLFGVEHMVTEESLRTSIFVLVDPSPAELVAQLRSLAKNPNRLNDASQKCREFALMFYSERNASAIQKAYLHDVDQ